MKNEKFCFSKGTGLIALVGILLVGFVIANQMLTSTQTSTNSRAANTNSPTLGGSTPAPQGTIVLSELLSKTDKAMTAITAVIKGCAVQTNGAGCAGATNKQTTLTSARKAVNAAFSILTGTKNPDTQIVPSEGTLTRQLQNITAYLEGVELKKDYSADDLSKKTEAASTAENNWNNAIQDTKDAQKKVDDQISLYQGSFMKFNTSLDAFVRVLKTLPTITTVQSTINELEKLKLDNFNTSNTDLKTSVGFDKFVEFDTKISAPSVSSGTSTVDDFESYLSSITDKKNFREAYSSFHSTLTTVVSDKQVLDGYKSTLATTTSTEAAKKTVYDTAVIARAKAANIDAVYGELAANITVAEQALKALQIKSDAVLPAGPARLSSLVVPNTNGVDVSVYASVQNALDVVNQALVDTNAAYKTLDDSITASNDETVSQASAYNDYCKSIKPYKKNGTLIQKFFPVIDPSLTVVGADGIPVGLASDVARFYKETQCDKNASNYVWNGSWGDTAKCYTATGVCSIQQGCRTTDCIANIAGSTPCIYREVPVENCDPDLLANKTLTCASSGQYFKVGNDYYETNGLREKNGKKYCGSKKIESTDTTTIQAARNYITTTLTNKDQAKDRECKLSSKFGVDNNRTKFAVAYQNLLGQAATSGSYTPSMVCYHMSARSNGTGDRCLNELATDANGQYSDKLCNCQVEMRTNKDVSIQLVDGIYKCVGSKYFSD